MLLAGVHQQRTRLAEWRATMARVTKTEKHKGGEGETWRIEYEWELLSGAVRRGRRDVAKKPPEPGELIPLLYERDSPQRHTLWPLSFVR
jgi:hypothetical protein